MNCIWLGDVNVVRLSEEGCMKNVNRREFIGSSAIALAIGPASVVFSNQVLAADTPKVDPIDPQAKALSYVHLSAKEDENCASTLFVVFSEYCRLTPPLLRRTTHHTPDNLMFSESPTDSLVPAPISVRLGNLPRLHLRTCTRPRGTRYIGAI